jgi:hypothetical protein
MDQEQPTQWLLEGLREGDAATKAARLGGLSEVEWNQVVAVSLHNGVAPLLYSRMKRLAEDRLIPLEMLRELRAAYLATAERNLRLYRELAAVLSAFQQGAIPVIVLKGAHLAKLVYGNIALRPMGDLDLLVKKSDLVGAAAQLRELGYTAAAARLDEPGPDGQAPPGLELACAHGHHLPPFVRPGAAAAIEVHWTLVDIDLDLDIDVDGLWARAQSVVLAGVPTLGLCPVDLLLHQCVHAGEHHRYLIGLRPFCDLAQILQHYQAEMPWEQVRLRAQQWRVGKGVYLTLRLLGRLLDTPVPEPVLAALRPPDFDESWEVEAGRQFRALAFGVVRQHIKLRTAKYGSLKFLSLMGRRPLRAKVRIALKALFPPRTEMRELYQLPMHSRRVYLLYPVRIWFLTRKYCRVGLRLAWRRPQGWYQYVALANDQYDVDKHLPLATGRPPPGPGHR